MSATPQPLAERIFNNPTGRASEATSQRPQTLALWRLVDRDGSTSSPSLPGAGPADSDCAHCRAGRCGQDVEGCHCADGREEAAFRVISVDQLIEPTATARRNGKPASAAMPLAKPRLLATPPPSSPPRPEKLLELSCGNWPNLLAGESRRSPDIHTIPRASHVSPDAAPRELDAPAAGTPREEMPSAPPLDPELHRVVEAWPLLSLGIREAILALARTRIEAETT